MDYFNKFKSFLEQCPNVGDKEIYKILSYTGDTSEWKRDQGLVWNAPKYSSYKDRKNVSDKDVKAVVTVYHWNELRHLQVRRNTRGIFFNWDGVAIYISKEPLPDHMK